MSGSYRQCVECGKRALRFATRCPGCGIALPNPAPLEDDSTRQLSWPDSLKGVMAVLVIGAVMVSIKPGSTGPSELSAETSFAKPAIVEKAAPSVVEALPVGASVELVANGWTHVRSRRTVNATLEAVLTPGDTVTADSLANGWYRVALYGEVLGYAKETTLAVP